MPQAKSYVAVLGETKSLLTWHQPVPVLFGLLSRCDAPGCWYLGGPEGCMVRRQHFVEFLTLADDAELARSIDAGYLLTPEEVERIRATGRPRANRARPAPTRPAGRAVVRTHHAPQPGSGPGPVEISARQLEAIGS